MTDEDREILDGKALRNIQLYLAPLMTFNITKGKMIEELMETLSKLYEKPFTSNTVFLMKYLFNTKKAEDGSVVDHLHDFNTITKLSSMVINFYEENRVLLILCSFPKSWNGMVMVMSNFVSGSNTLKFDDVISVILSEETCRKSLGGSTSRSALNAQI